MFDAECFWQDIAQQNRERLHKWFAPDAVICWHCTNEQFTVAEFLVANCDYPGQWHGAVERIDALSEEKVVTITHVWNEEKTISCHVVSFFCLQGAYISRLDEYWGDDTSPPQWRQELKIGREITR